MHTTKCAREDIVCCWQTRYREWFRAVDIVFFSIYVLEFLLKLYARPFCYWACVYNLFDFAIIVLAAVQVRRVWHRKVSFVKSQSTAVVLGSVTWCTLGVSFSFFVRNLDQIVRVCFTNDLQSQTG